MNIVPSLKTFRLLLIALLAVALTGGIAFIKASPAAAAGDAAISLEVSVFHQSRIGNEPSGTPIYVRGTGLLPGSTLTLSVKARGANTGEIYADGSYSQEVPSNGAAFPSIAFPALLKDKLLFYDVKLTVHFDPSEYGGCLERYFGDLTGVQAAIHLTAKTIGNGVFLKEVPVPRHDIVCNYSHGGYEISDGSSFLSSPSKGLLQGILFGGLVGGAEEGWEKVEGFCTDMMRSEGKC